MGQASAAISFPPTPPSSSVDAFEGPPPPPSRDALRSRRKRDVRASSISVRKLTMRELAVGRALYPRDEQDAQRPATREGCAGVPRPCPFVSCKHHLYLDVSRTGSIKLNFPDLEPHELVESCSLDVAGRGGTTLQEVADIMNLTRERIRQLEVSGLAELQSRAEVEALREHVGEGPRGKRRLPVLQRRDDDDFDVDRFAGDELDGE